ncbi:unnamed protein product [Phytophthora fragariaefolia]|uniref:Unnamed protein product n=1 Tax=Phytophthora fragariaefolia TaxID=1490495 RepID=A0A9W6U0N1_9STRA|nr:unnamed protein product [Phytophthora fragariaefolia]
MKNRDFKSPAALGLLSTNADRADSGESGTQTGISIVDRDYNSVSMDLSAAMEGMAGHEQADHLPPNNTVDMEPKNAGVLGSQSGSERDEEPVRSSPETPAISATLELARDGGFEVASPQKSHGRPTQTARAKKSARSKIVSIAQDDSDMYASGLSLTNVEDAVNNEPTHDSAAALLQRLTLFDFVLALQKQQENAGRANLAEKDVAVEIIGVGLYSTNTLIVMKNWHRAMKSMQHVDKAVNWIDTIDFDIQMADQFKVEPDATFLSKIKAIPLLSVRVPLELVGKSALGDDTVNTLMMKMFAGQVNIVVINTSVIGNIMNGFMPVESMRNLFTGVSTEKY